MPKSSNRRKQEAAVPPPPALPPSDDQTEVLRRQAHDRLDELFRDAKRGRFHGELAITILFQHGAAQLLRRRLEGTDK
jgi:hypothetical protein